MGLIADLTAGEIMEQAVHALQLSPFKNVVFMGMVSLALPPPPPFPPTLDPTPSPTIVLKILQIFLGMISTDSVPSVTGSV